MAFFSKYRIEQRGKLFFPVLKSTGETHGPSTGFHSKKVCQHWIDTVGDK